jgi:hypothetical protein
MSTIIPLLFVLPALLWHVAVLWLLWRILKAVERRPL